MLMEKLKEIFWRERAPRVATIAIGVALGYTCFSNRRAAISYLEKIARRGTERVILISRASQPEVAASLDVARFAKNRFKKAVLLLIGAAPNVPWPIDRAGLPILLVRDPGPLTRAFLACPAALDALPMGVFTCLASGSFKEEIFDLLQSAIPDREITVILINPRALGVDSEALSEMFRDRIRIVEVETGLLTILLRKVEVGRYVPRAP
jgi:hypothetical protein